MFDILSELDSATIDTVEDENCGNFRIGFIKCADIFYIGISK